MNRVWGWHFGQPIVGTPNDLGRQGEPPSHPRLLDWLARDFIANGWSLKGLHRLILLSSAYQMSGLADAGGGAAAAGMRVDPRNNLLWHFPRTRLDADEVRDAMLACAGTINPRPFGPPVVPPLSGEELTGLFDAAGKWKVSKDPADYTRRSVYLLQRRTFVYPLLSAFDPPEVMNSCPRRLQTVVPAQALTLLNSPVARQQSAAFAARLAGECGDDDQAAVARAWVLAFGREITPPESDRARQLLRLPRVGPDPARRGPGEFPRRALTDLCLALFNSNEFVYVD